ncbi:MAG: aminodeoxychorismate synthase component I, partial [Armatimonadota bacterium]
GLCTERPLPFPKGRGKSELCEDGGRGEWNQSINAIHHAIARGETYQVNLTRRLRARMPADFDPLALYEHLRTAQAGTRYAAYLDTGRFQIASASPELFFATESQRIITRPMKGTARRGRWTEEDEQLAEALAASEKDRAENVMIVDLLRNDLGRIAAIGSVHVVTLFAIERYPTVFQMTSTVEATLREGIGLTEIFGALFPCGSVTGAPKVSTMRHIATLESEPRGVYCGAIGIVQPGGDAVFNVAIRTLVHDAETGVAEYGVGGGITWDSTAAEEWAETKAKAAVLTQTHADPEFDLLETLRLENGQYTLRARHLARLADSAAYFSRRVDMGEISQALDTFAEAHPEGIWRVRLLVSLEGKPTVEGTAFAFSPSEPLPMMVAKTPADSQNVFLFHKTTRREVYETHRKALPEGIYDALLWNENGDVTEFTSANLVAEIAGVRWTPPRQAGLLAGTFRNELLANGEIQERTLTIADIVGA